MIKTGFFLTSACALLLGAGLCLPLSVHADGDPTDLTLDDLMAQEAAENIPTVTAEGDFIVPTYLLPTQETAPVPTPMPAFESRTVLLQTDLPVVETQNMQVVETPVAPVVQPASVPVVLPVLNPTEGRPVTISKPLLVPLAPVKKVQTETVSVPVKKRTIVPSDYADRVLSAVKNGESSAVLPQEIKITFYKNDIALSGQSLKWVRAFALQTLKDPRRMVEVRLSQCNPSIQKARLSVIENVLLGTGLSPHQIQIVWTKRGPDSLVLRSTEKPQDVEVIQKTTSSGNQVKKKTIKW